MCDATQDARAPKVDLVEFVSAMPLPVAVLSDVLEMAATNAAFDAVALRLGWRGDGSGSRGSWSAVAAAAAAVVRDGSSCELAVRDTCGGSWRVHVSRLNTQLDQGPRLLLLMQGQPASAADRLRDYARRRGLTPTETGIVAALLDGMRPQQIAVHNGVSIHTVRAQIASVLGKSGCRCQSQLIADVLGGGSGGQGGTPEASAASAIARPHNRRHGVHDAPTQSLLTRSPRGDGLRIA